MEGNLPERPVPDLNRTVDSLRAAEMSRSHKEVMSGKASSVDHMRDHSGRNRTQHSSQQANVQQYQSQSNRRSYSNLPKKFRCNWCGTANQTHARRDCPARDSTCNNCKKKGHWSVVCKSMSAHEIHGNKGDEIQGIHSTEPHSSDNSSTHFLGEVEAIEDDFWSANIHVNSHKTTFKLDTGSKICVFGSSTPWIKKD